ncbi:MAG: metallophosphoesterase [Hyphomonadaceae bacterium]|nr:metallophosphoesterase [Hyphomonadaceae bacterium]
MAEGRRLYAVGDIHGRADLLNGLLSQIEADIRVHATEGVAPTLVFLGDYVDRGLESRRCVETLIGLAAGQRDVHFLKGKHDDALLTFLEQPATGARWLGKGGAETLFSYGVRAPANRHSLRDLTRASEALRAAMPADHLDFFRRLRLHVRFGDYLFVHAGLKPGVALDQQRERDLISIRGPFLRSRERWPFVVVHGHSPAERFYRDARRIGIDTGAYATGRLSAVCLEGDAVRLFST